MSKANMVIVEAVMSGKELKEITFVEVQAGTLEVGASFTVKRDSGVFTDLEIANIARKMLDGRKLVSHSGLDETMDIINALFRAQYGYPYTVARENVVDTHVLLRRYETKRFTLTEAANHYGMPVLSMESSNQKARMTYGLLQVLFQMKGIRQFTYIKSIPCFVPEPRA